MTIGKIEYRGFFVQYVPELAEDALAMHGIYVDREIKEMIDLYLDHGILEKKIHMTEIGKWKYGPPPFIMTRITKILENNEIAFTLRKENVNV